VTGRANLATMRREVAAGGVGRTRGGLVIIIMAVGVAKGAQSWLQCEREPENKSQPPLARCKAVGGTACGLELFRIVEPEGALVVAEAPFEAKRRVYQQRRHLPLFARVHRPPVRLVAVHLKRHPASS
jgi:hypothetical protein